MNKTSSEFIRTRPVLRISLRKTLCASNEGTLPLPGQSRVKSTAARRERLAIEQFRD